MPHFKREVDGKGLNVEANPHFSQGEPEGEKTDAVGKFRDGVESIYEGVGPSEKGGGGLLDLGEVGEESAMDAEITEENVDLA